MLRTPDLRLGDIRTLVLRGATPFDYRVNLPDRGVFVYALKGDFEVEIEQSGRGWISAPEGTAAGFERGSASRWRAVRAGDDGEVALFTSSIPQRMGVLQQLEDGVIIVPPDAEPSATILRLATELHAHEAEHPAPGGGEEIVRRCAEIVLIQFVRFAQDRNAEQHDVPAGLSHDDALLRAWTAYFAEPQRRWTLQALADAAGLGRTVFAERFRKVFGKPPLQTLTEMRLEQAEYMLRSTRAPLIEIAFTIGYNSEAAFVRAFHRQFGMPPGRFRAEHGMSA